MLLLLLTLIFLRPFISSLAFPLSSFIYSCLLLSSLVIWIVRRGLTVARIKPVQYPLLLFILALLISVAFSQNIALSIARLDKYLSAILILTIASSLGKDADKIISCLLFAALAISCLAIYQYLFGFQHVLNYMAKNSIYSTFTQDYLIQKRVFFPFVTPNTLAGYLAMLLGFAFAEKHKIIFLLPLISALLLTRSLGGMISAAFATFLYFYLARNVSKKRASSIVVLAMLIVLAVFAVRLTATKTHFQPAFSAAMRFSYWRDTLRIIAAHPLVGIGVGNFNLAYSRFSHNSYLQIWAEMGILGITSFLWIIAALLKNALKNIKSRAHKNRLACLIAGSAAFCIHNLFDFSFYLPEVSLLWWVICGLMLAQVIPQRTKFQ